MTFPHNYSRFFALLAKLPKGEGITAEELRHSLVAQYSNGRTTSLRELTPDEYATLCSALEQQLGLREQLREQRSKTLKLMQRLGIDTSNWDRVNAFCQDTRISPLLKLPSMSTLPYNANSEPWHARVASKSRKIRPRQPFS